MRVRVWINGADGPCHDFELVDAPPRAGEHICLAMGDHKKEGVVASVSWHLLGIERSERELTFGGDPVGSVTMVHVVCGPSSQVARAVPITVAAAEQDINGR
jgi:hypothetical protein